RKTDKSHCASSKRGGEAAAEEGPAGRRNPFWARLYEAAQLPRGPAGRMEQQAPALLHLADPPRRRLGWMRRRHYGPPRLHDVVDPSLHRSTRPPPAEQNSAAAHSAPRQRGGDALEGLPG